MSNSFTTEQVLRSATETLLEIGCDTPRLDAEVLLMDTLSWERTDLVSRTRDVLEQSQLTAFRQRIHRRKAREPVAHILGRKEFWSLEFCVSDQVLVPRPDSEVLIETCIRHFADRKHEPLRILDLGTGSGCLILTLLTEFPNATGLGTDVSSEALSIASSNAVRHRLTERVTFLEGDWYDAIDRSHEGQKFDLIVANPPYISTAELAGLMPEVTNFEPRIALDGGENGLAAYETIVCAAPDFLLKAGALALELGSGQAERVSRLLQAQSFTDIGVQKDLAGFERCAIATI